MTLEEEIAALNNEIADYKRQYDSAVANGNEAMQISLLATITTRGNNLDKLLDRQREERRFHQQIHHSQPHTQFQTMTLEEEIAALNNEIAHCWTLHATAVANGNEARQDLLLATITTRGNNLDKLLDRQREERRFHQQIHHSQPHTQLAYPHQQSGTLTLLIIFFVHDFGLPHKFLKHNQLQRLNFLFKVSLCYICVKLNYFLLCLSYSVCSFVFPAHFPQQPQGTSV
jgi:uncharacterized small protein (DUF1192 family)